MKSVCCKNVSTCIKWKEIGSFVFFTDDFTSAFLVFFLQGQYFIYTFCYVFNSSEDEKAKEKLASDGSDENPIKSSAEEEVQSVEAIVTVGQEVEDNCENRETKPEVEACGGQEKSGDTLCESYSPVREWLTEELLFCDMIFVAI